MPRPSVARRRRPVGGTSLLKVADRTPFPNPQRRETELGCGREGNRGATAHRGRFPPPCRELPARRVARGPPVAWACAEHFCASVGLEAAGRSTAVFGSRAASKLLVCGGSRLRTGLPRLERLREKTEGRQRAGGTSALPKPSSSALCFGRPARAAALSFAGVPKAARFRRRRAPLVTRLGSALVWGTRGQRMEEASGFIGRVISFCGLETSPAASRRLSRQTTDSRRAM